MLEFLTHINDLFGQQKINKKQTNELVVVQFMYNVIYCENQNIWNIFIIYYYNYIMFLPFPKLIQQCVYVYVTSLPMQYS